MCKRQDRALLKISFRIAVVFILILLISCQQKGPPQSLNTPSFTVPAETLVHPAETEVNEEAASPTPIPVSPSPTTEPTLSSAKTGSPDDPGCGETGGRLQLASFFSPILQENLSYRIYLPPCYDQAAEQAYPVVYLLHGLGYTQEQWARLGLVDQMDILIARQEAPPFIIIMPQESRFEPPQTSLFGEAVVVDLVPWVDAHYRTLPEAAYRAVGGISRGGAWAVRIGLTHYQVFSKVGAHSLPLFDADGGNIHTWLTTLGREDYPSFYIDIGRDDAERENTRAFADLLDSFSVPHEWYLFNGEHSEAYWAAHLDEYLKWYGSTW
jgi:enterochelin esterase-like enzyme